LPDVFLLITSGAAALLLLFVVYQAVRVEPREPLRMVSVPARSSV
jgi:hypothetical protein